MGDDDFCAAPRLYRVKMPRDAGTRHHHRTRKERTPVPRLESRNQEWQPPSLSQPRSDAAGGSLDGLGAADHDQPYVASLAADLVSARQASLMRAA